MDGGLRTPKNRSTPTYMHEYRVGGVAVVAVCAEFWHCVWCMSCSSVLLDEQLDSRLNVQKTSYPGHGREGYSQSEARHCSCFEV